jgi:CDGSH-type Zn-finger protein
MEVNDTAPRLVEVIVKAPGPIIVNADLQISKADGTVETKLGKAVFCGCGASANKPFCDGTHKTLNAVPAP